MLARSYPTQIVTPQITSDESPRSSLDNAGFTQVQANTHRTSRPNDGSRKSMRSRPGDHASRRLTEADAYCAITTAWCGSVDQDRRMQHPMRPYFIARSFTQSTLRLPGATAADVFRVCARIISDEELELRDVLRTRKAISIGEPYDPAGGWWHPLCDPSLGVHFWRLALGIIELRTVAAFASAPQLEVGRYAATRSRRRHLWLGSRGTG